MTRDLILHYAPDNASLCVRMLLEELALPFETRLVDRAQSAQKSQAYLALNPNGLIPVLQTPDGTMFETAAILLWLADQRPGTVFPAVTDPARAGALTRLFWLSNTLHTALRMTFYPGQYTTTDAPGLRRTMHTRFETLLTHLETSPADHWLEARTPQLLGCYLAPMLRWAVVYGETTQSHLGKANPRLYAFAKSFETMPPIAKACSAEGLGPAPISMPQPAAPPEGSPI